MTIENESIEIRRIFGGMIFAAKHPLSINEMRRILRKVAENKDLLAGKLAGMREPTIRKILDEVREEFDKLDSGVHLVEIAGGFKFQNDAISGPWVRVLLGMGAPSRLSQPALETLAIIAYRQPITRSEIESVRGVNVDHVMRTLLEMQLVRIAGRSELPGRPLLYESTERFLEHFGLRNLMDLPSVEELMRVEAKRQKTQKVKEPGQPELPVNEEASLEESDLVEEDAGKGEEPEVEKEIGGEA